mmetsp:Transcript_60764/g.178246  ORF Transcript_60764/g.178246 Transcript_60764/m.178246 type:complete len:251 (-) Transcript_60764:301-1053(-)
MFCSLFSSRFAIFCASGLMFAFFRDMRRDPMSSSSSSPSSPSSEPESPPSLGPPAPPLPLLSLRNSFLRSPSCRRSTVSRSSSSLRFCIFELISFESFWTSTTFLMRSWTSSRRFGISNVSSTCWRSTIDSCASPAAIMSARTDAEAGHRTRLLLPKKFFRAPPAPPCGEASLRSSVTFCCTPCISALTSAEASEASRSSSRSIVATWNGAVWVNFCTRKRVWPSMDRVTTLTSLSPTLDVLCAWEAILQ